MTDEQMFMLGKAFRLRGLALLIERNDRELLADFAELGLDRGQCHGVALPMLLRCGRGF